MRIITICALVKAASDVKSEYIELVCDYSDEAPTGLVWEHMGHVFGTDMDIQVLSTEVSDVDPDTIFDFNF